MPTYTTRVRNTVYRSISANYNYTIARYSANNAVGWTMPAISRTVEYSDASITDQVCSDGSLTIAERKRDFHPVTSIKRTFVWKPGIMSNMYESNCYGNYYYMSGDYPAYNHGITTASDWSNLNLAGISPIPTQLELDEAKYRIKPNIGKMLDDTVNIYEILGELTHFKRLIKPFERPDFSTVTKTVDTVSNIHLGYRFGVKPTVSTISSILTLGKKLDVIVDKWNRAAYGGKVWDFHETIKTVNDTVESVTETIPSVNKVKEINASSTVVSKSILHIYFHPLPIPDDLRFNLKLRAFGLNKPITGAWELLPWSWAIDYFLDIQSKISRWEDSLYESLFTIKLLNSGYSTKTVRSDSLTQVVYSCGNPESTPDTVVSTESSFTRVPISVEGFFDNLLTPSGVSWRVPSLDQTGLLASAGWQFFRKQ